MAGRVCVAYPRLPPQDVRVPRRPATVTSIPGGVAVAAHLWGWFTSSVWPNIVASAVWAWPALAWHHRKVRRRLDAIHAHARAAARCEPSSSYRSEPPVGGER